MSGKRGFVELDFRLLGSPKDSNRDTHRVLPLLANRQGSRFRAQDARKKRHGGTALAAYAVAL